MKAIDIQITQVDRLGLLLAQIADLTKEADAIKDEIKEAATAGGPSSYEGNLYKQLQQVIQFLKMAIKAITLRI